MTEQFNPYFHWLGIPLAEQPPHYYRLLALRPFEQNPAVIQRAADHWLAQLQPYRQGPYGPYAEQLLREIWTARSCLLDPRSKPAYDARLYQAMQTQAADEQVQDVAVDASVIGLRRRSPPPLRRRPPGIQQLLVVMMVLAVCGGAVTLLVTAMRATSQPEPVRRVARDDEFLHPAIPGAKPSSDSDSQAEKPTEVHVRAMPGAAFSPLGGEFDLSKALAVSGSGGGFRSGGFGAAGEKSPAGKSGDTSVPERRRPAPPRSNVLTATDALKETYAKEIARKESVSQVALAAQWIEKSRTLEKYTDRYAMLMQAKDLAAREDQCQLAMLAIDELMRWFEAPGPDLKVEVLAQFGKPARSVGSFLAILDAGAQVGREGFGSPAFEKLLAAVKTWDLGALRKSNPSLAQGLQELRRRLEELIPFSRQALATSSAATPDALWLQAQAAAVFREDWDQALPLLARCNRAELAKAAAAVVAEPKNARAFLALGDAWWGAAEGESNTAVVKPRMRLAAGHWYEKAMPRLVEEELQRARERVLIASGASLGSKTTPLAIPLSGLLGQVTVAPGKFSGDVQPGGGFAALSGDAHIEYPQLPTSTYVHELELTFNGGGANFSIQYGDPCQGIRLDFVPAGDSGYRGHLTHYTAKTAKNFKSKEFPAGKKFSLTLYVNESKQSGWTEKREFTDAAAAPADLAIQISNRGKGSVAISRCEIRPFEAGDADALRWPRPLAKGTGRGEEAALRWYSRNMGLTERAAVNTPAPFVVAATGTPMQWVPPGALKHVNYGAQPEERLDPTSITLPRGFWIGRCEITQREWLALMPHNPGRIVGSPFLPVDGVSWEEATTFCRLLAQQEDRAKRLPRGYTYRLPTEAEWELACQGGKGEEYAVESAGFWCQDTSEWRLHEAGEGKPNAYGLYDMHGNIAEWCLDAWSDPPLLPPQTLADPFFRSPEPKNIFYVQRGGGWWSLRRDCSASVRQQACSVPGGHRGFRIALAPVR